MSNILEILYKLDENQKDILISKIEKEGHKYNLFPLSLAQERLWFFSKLNPSSTAYNIPTAIRIKGNLNLRVFEKSLQYLIDRHESLRTSIIEIKDTAFQYIEKSVVFKYEMINISNNQSEISSEEYLNDLIRKESAYTLNLSKSPLLKVNVFKIEDDDFVILFLIHHLISDGWSVNLLIKEFAIAYNNFLNNLEPNLPALSVQYADFSVWQKEWVKSKEFESQLNFWAKQLTNSEYDLRLPYDYENSKLSRGLLKTLQNKISSVELNRIRNKLEVNEISDFMILLSVYFITLSIYCQQNEITIGLPIANRNRLSIENVIGLFINTIVIKLDNISKKTVRQLVLEVKDLALSAFSNQDLPFEKLVEKIQPERNIKKTPLFQTLFSFQSNLDRKIEFQNLIIENYPTSLEESKFDIILNAGKISPEEYQINFEYDSNLFKETTIHRFSNAFKKLIDELPLILDQKIAYLNINSKEDENKLSVWSLSNKVKNKDLTFVDLFNNSAAKFSNNIAVNDSVNSLTYSQLLNKSNYFAQIIKSSKINPNSPIIVYIDRHIDAITAMIAIMKAGCFYIPLDPNYPSERIKYILNDSKSNLILSIKKFENNLSEFNSEVIYLDDKEVIEEINFVSDRIDKLSLAYCIYTSGSTGLPKGSLISHYSLMNLYNDLKTSIYNNLKKDNVNVSLNASISFDASLQQIIALLMGHSIIIIPEDIRIDGKRLLKFINENDIKVFDCVPTQLEFLLEENEKSNLYSLPEYILPGGEAISQILWDKIKKYDSKFLNMYGPTECTVDTLKCLITKDLTKPLIGLPIQNTQIYVLNESLIKLPIGVVGELYISGDPVGIGYYNKPKLTAEKFLPDPFSLDSGARMYRTGDLVKYNDDGYLEFIGRNDDQIKLRGLRIELSEIDNQLKLSNLVSKSVTITDTSVEPFKIVTFCISTLDQVSENDLKSFLISKLPAYMVPARILFVNEFPLLPNKKVDKNKLISKLKNIEYESISYITSDPIEKIIQDTFIEVLKKDKVGLNENFFALGGHSLLATKVISRLSEKLNFQLPLKSIFEYSDIFSLAKYIGNTSSKFNLDLPISKIDRTDDIPLSFAQQRLWFLDQLAPQSSFYNIPFVLKIKGKIILENVEKSINKIIEKHEILRTSFNSKEGKAYQRIHSGYQIKLKLELGNERTFENISEIIHQEIEKPFDLTNIPLFRLKIYQLHKDEFILILVIHHIISDGWSTVIFFDEFTNYYNLLSENKSINIIKLKYQYSDFASWQRKYLQGENLKKLVKFWETELRDVPQYLELPLDFTRPPVQTFNGNLIEFKIPRNHFDDIKNISLKKEVTPFVFFLTTFQVLLSKFSRQKDFCIGTPVANRNRLEIEPLIGFFVNTLVLRTSLEYNQTFTDLLFKVKERTYNAFNNQDIPFEKLLDELNIERNVSHSPLFQVMFTFQNIPTVKKEINDLKIEELSIKTSKTKFDLSLTISEGNDQVYNCSFEYNTDLFTENTIRKFIDKYLQLINILSIKPNLKLSEINLLSKSEFEQLVYSYNETFIELSPKTNIITIFENHCLRQPNNIALTFNNYSITYSQLNSKANIIANLLIELKVKREEKIGIYFYPSIEMIIAIWGIIKAGCTYVPLDPNYPKARINAIIYDAKINYLITKSDLKESLVDDDKIKVLNLDLIDNNLRDNNPNVIIDGKNLAYIIYTSGSTGRPKGVACTHLSLINNLQDLQIKKAIIPGDKCSIWSSINFDVSVLEIFSCYFGGAELVIIPNEKRIDSKEFFDFIALNKINSAYFPPFSLSDFNNNLKNYNQVLSLKRLIVGVEPIQINILKDISNKVEDLKIINGYGPSEATICCTTFEVNGYETITGITPIGKPMSNVKIYLLDEELNPVPHGITGEIFIGGLGLSRGYINDPAQTAQRFLPDPFSNKIGERIYKTGDLAKLNEDGNIIFKGRIDNQIKLRGYRVETEEIDSVLNGMEEIKSSITILKDFGIGIKQLTTYYVLEENYEISIDELKKQLAIHLPDYMIPSKFIKLDKIPLTINGKVDRKKIETLELDLTIDSTKIVPPKTEKEKILYKIWKETLGIENFSITDNFFELGGDSIIGIQVISKLRKYSLSLKPVDLFRYQTIQQLSLVLEELNKFNAEQGIVEGQFPPTPIIKDFFELKLNYPNHWNQSILFKIKGKVNQSALKSIFDYLIIHHDILRLRVIVDNNKQALFLPSNNFLPKLEIIDLNYFGEKDIKIEIENHCSTLQTSLNIFNGPIAKFVYFNTPNSEGRLLIVFHHLVVDGISWRIFLEDLQTLYSQYLEDKKFSLPPKTTSFKEWALKLNQFSFKNIKKEVVEYWLNICSKINPAFDYSEGKIFIEENSESSSIEFNEKDTQELLNNVNKKYNTQLNDVLLTSILRSYSRISGKRTLSMIFEGHGREDIIPDIDISRTMGWFTTTYPILLDLKKSINISESLITIKDQLRQIPDNGISFGILKNLSEDFNKQEILTESFSKISIIYNYLGQVDQILKANSIFTLSNENKGLERNLKEKRFAPIDITAIIQNNKLQVLINYDKINLQKNQIEKWLDYFKQEIESLLISYKEEENGALTKSDFKLANLTDDKLSKVLSKLK